MGGVVGVLRIQQGGGVELEKWSTTPRYVQRSFVEQGGDPLDPPCPSGGPPGGPCREQQTSAPIVCLGGRTEGGGRRDRELGGEDGGGARQRVEGHGCLKAYTKAREAREAREGRCRTTGGGERQRGRREGESGWVSLGWLGLAWVGKRRGRGWRRGGRLSRRRGRRRRLTESGGTWVSEGVHQGSEGVQAYTKAREAG